MKLLASMTGMILILFVWAHLRVEPLPNGLRAGKVLVEKSARKLTLLQHDKPLSDPEVKKNTKNYRKTRPSYMDRYKIIAFEDDPDEDYGILVNLRRISDGKKFTLPLADLKATDKLNPSNQILDDYSVWFANWR